MITRIAAALLLASLAVGPQRVRAQENSERLEPNADEIRTVEACLGKRKPKRERYRCIGLVADRCQEEPGGSSTIGMRICLDREFKIWNQLSHRYARAAARVAARPARQSMADAQRAWARAVDKFCDWPTHFFEGGTIMGPLAIRCLMEQTALRGIDLLELKQWAEPH